MGNAKWAKRDNKSVNVVISAVKLNSPDFAQTLVDPLFAFGVKRGLNFFIFYQNPLYAQRREGGPAKRRPGE